VIAVVSGLATSAAAQAPVKVPRDFALRLRFGCAMADTIDTFRGEYVRDIGPQYAIQRTWLSFSGKHR
jgi:hypothetical protein